MATKYTDTKEVIESNTQNSIIISSQATLRDLDLAIQGDPRFRSLNDMLVLADSSKHAIFQLAQWLAPKRVVNSKTFDKQLREDIKTVIDAGLLWLAQLSSRIADKIEERYPNVNKPPGIREKAKPTKAVAKKSAVDPKKSAPEKEEEGDKEDLAIKKRIYAAIQTPKCGGYRGFDSYAGGKAYESFFEELAILTKTFQNFETSDLQGIFMFGPPGTGKSRLAEAVAAKLSPLGSTFISISASDLKGKYVGESEKGVKMLFDVARERTNRGKNAVVIFIDEIDGVLSKTDSSTGILSEINKQMQGIGSSNKGLVVMAATNYPARIPAAAMSRFQNAQLYIGLPTADQIYQQLHIIFSHYSRTRYAGEIVVGDPAQYKNTKVVQSLHIRDADNDEFTFLESVALYLFAKGFSGRDVDSVFRKISAKTMRAAHDFFVGVSPDAEGWTVQSWLLDTSYYSINVQKGNKCSIVYNRRHQLVPLATFINGDISKPVTVGDYTGKLTVNNDDVRMILTKKRVDEQTNSLDIYPSHVWSTAKQNWVQWEGQMFDIQRVLGFAQITESIMLETLQEAKPGNIEDIDQLIEYVKNSGELYGQTAEQAIARLEDVKNR